MSERKQYTKEFKEDAVRLVTEHGYTRAGAARSLGIQGNMLARWVQEYQNKESEAFLGNGKLTSEQAELKKLRTENKQLRLEREILKKAAAFFAKETN
jgi:transposase